jgi:hypothetical protein
MTEPEQEDLTAQGDALVEPTDNGLRPEDPPEEQQPPQDPSWLPEGTPTERQDSGR